MLLYAITDRSSYGGTEPYRQESLIREARRWASDGIDFIQVREKDLAAGELVGLVRRIVAAVRDAGAGTRVLVNSRLDVAIAAGADGVHLTSGPGELRPEQVRRLFPDAVVSVSCHSVEEVARAAGWGVDGILFGPVFGKTVGGVEVVPEVGIEALRLACEAAKGAPVLALGGVTRARAKECAEAGAAGIAGIRLFGSASEEG
jgi:thiamine-phosphate pyrophosphorylase